MRLGSEELRDIQYVKYTAAMARSIGITSLHIHSHPPEEANKNAPSRVKILPLLPILAGDLT